MPWKHIQNPYFIWLSEIILQQTRVDQGTAYYQKFIKAYPTVQDLANAGQDEVFKHWEGLGYYSRARNLHASAKVIAHELNGQFPNNYKNLLKLKGVGPYTAAAIASFAFDLPHAVLDGNVFRVLSRYFNNALPIDTTEGKKHYNLLAQQLLPPKQAALYNQAIMDLGASVCTPKKPDCDQCPLVQKCGAFAAQNAASLPVKLKKIKKRKRYFHFLLIDQKEGFFIHKRTQKDIWEGLYQFPLIEASTTMLQKEVLLEEMAKILPDMPNVDILKKDSEYKQTLTHQQIFASFWTIKFDGEQILNPPKNFLLVKPKNWRKFAFPKIISLFFDNNNSTL